MQAYLWALGLAAFTVSVIALVVAWSAFERANQPPVGPQRDKGGRFRKA